MQGDERASDEDVLRDLLECAQAWEPDARLIGNVRAGDAVRVLTTLAAKAGEIAALRAEVDEYAEITRGFGATIEELGPANEQLRAELSRLRARDERAARVIEAARRAVWQQTENNEAHNAHQALSDALDALDDATDAAEIEAAHDLRAACGPSVEERAAESAGPADRPEVADALARVSEGACLIAAERRRQVEAEGWSAKHDESWDHGQLAWAAVCYAAPERVYRRTEYAAGPAFSDPWPWEPRWDKRASTDRLRALAKAGALIAAEIDRLIRTQQRIGASVEDRAAESARRVEYRDIGLPHPVGYCSVCHLPVDCLSGEDVCSCVSEGPR